MQVIFNTPFMKQTAGRKLHTQMCHHLDLMNKKIWQEIDRLWLTLPRRKKCLHLVKC